ncbi:MAG: hypothetical protein IJE48_01620 [Clostridia bacterium]|nr:hypothetical protein [Clostridia bacterium]
MCEKFYVCRENELKESLRSKKLRKTPKIYMVGYTQFSNWIYEDYSPDCDYHHESLYFVDYSNDGEDVVWDKFFNYTALKIFNEGKYEKITIDREEYSIDVICDEYSCYSLSAFWHSAEMSGEEIEWLKDKDG